ncbi:hypothetical protein D3C83_04810 [compost metagenome]
MQPVHVENPRREAAGDHGGDDHAEGGERHGGTQRHAETLGAGAHTAVEQDYGKRQRAPEIGKLKIVELDPSRAVFAGEQAEHQKDEQDWGPEARGKSACQYARQDEQRPQ